MKFLPAQFAYVLRQGDMRRDLRALALYLGFLALVVLLYTVLFHWIMWEVEGRRHSWLTGLYWTLTVMSTLGFGDITFTSDIGRAFSVVVLVSGIVLLLIVFPFAFISFFYAPWLEARLRTRAPRTLAEDAEGHVVFAAYDSVAEGLGRQLRLRGIPWYVIEPDPRTAADLLDEGVPAVTGHVGRPETWRGLRADRASLVVANRSDPSDSSLALALREVSDVMLVAIAEDPDAIDILELSGCDHVLHLKGRLGEHLAARVDAGMAGAHVVGTFRDQAIAEFTVHGTPLANRTLRETQLREVTGLNVVGVWRRGRFESSHPDLVLSDYTVPVVVGTREQLTDLESLLVIHQSNFHPVVVMGGGMVGRSTVRALAERKIPVHVVEQDRGLAATLEAMADRVVIGNAADRTVMDRAGISEAPSVVLTTNDDSMNAYLAVYCRRLNPDLRIVSRVTEEQNVEALYRAGADFVLSYATLGAQAILALMDGRELVLLGEGADFFRIPVPSSLRGKTLAESEIGKRTGLNVVAVDAPAGMTTNPPPVMRLDPSSQLVMIGTMQQRATFAKEYER